MNLDFIHEVSLFWPFLSVYRVVDFAPAGKILGHCEELYNVYQPEAFKNCWQRPGYTLTPFLFLQL